EILDQLGLVGPVLEGAQVAERIRIRPDRAPVGADFAATQRGSTPFPGARIFEQSRTERLLADALLEGPDGPVRVRSRWLVGADGASSTVRRQLGLPFEGVTDEATFCVADLHGVEGAAVDALTARF